MKAPDLGEDELRTAQARTVEHQVDRRPTAHAGVDPDALEDLRSDRPATFERVAVRAGRPRPAVARLHDQTVVEREPDEVGQLLSCSGLRATTNSESEIMPPLRTRGGARRGHRGGTPQRGSLCSSSN
jgi:hypothetical protein